MMIRTTIALLATLSLAGCIERPSSPREKRDKLDRVGLEDVVLKELPPMRKRVGAIYGDSVELVGVDWQPSDPHAGDSVEVSFIYRVTDEAEEDWKIFVHVDDHGGHGDRINGDHFPARGRYRTNVWRKNEVVRDVWRFKVPGNYQGEGLDLWTGFYQEGKDDRWPLSNRGAVQNDGQNRVLAAMVPVRP